jgi:hypothetical protein
MQRKFEQAHTTRTERQWQNANFLVILRDLLAIFPPKLCAPPGARKGVSIDHNYSKNENRGSRPNHGE